VGQGKAGKLLGREHAAFYMYVAVDQAGKNVNIVLRLGDGFNFFDLPAADEHPDGAESLAGYVGQVTLYGFCFHVQPVLWFHVEHHRPK
jgi:hypothetical protein